MLNASRYGNYLLRCRRYRKRLCRQCDALINPPILSVSFSAALFLRLSPLALCLQRTRCGLSLRRLTGGRGVFFGGRRMASGVVVHANANRSERIDISNRFAGGEQRGKPIRPKQQSPLHSPLSLFPINHQSLFLISNLMLF